MARASSALNAAKGQLEDAKARRELASINARRNQDLAAQNFISASALEVRMQEKASADAVYQIALANFNNETALNPIGSTAFTATVESAGNVMTGTLEQSNVDMTAELLKTVQAQQI